MHDFTDDSGRLHELYGDLEAAINFYTLHNKTCAEPGCRLKQFDALYTIGRIRESEKLVSECLAGLIGWLEEKGKERSVDAPYQLWRMFGVLFTLGERKRLVGLQVAAFEKRAQLFEEHGFGMFAKVGLERADIEISLRTAEIAIALAQKDLARAESLLPDLSAAAERRNTADARSVWHSQSGKVLMAKEDHETAAVHFQQAIEQISEDSLQLATLGLRVDLARAETSCGRLDTAFDLLDATADICADRSHLMTLTSVRLAQAEIARRRHDGSAERQALLDVLRCHRQHGPPVRGYTSLEDALQRLRERNWIDEEELDDLQMIDGVVFTELDCARIARAAAGSGRVGGGKSDTDWYD